MIKEKDSSDSKVNNLVATLHKRFERDEKRFKHKRCVYMYRSTIDGSIMDNVILLDYSTRHVHKTFLESRIYSIIDAECKLKNHKHLYAQDISFANLEIIQVGIFDKLNMKFERLPRSKKILDCYHLISKCLEERKINEKVSH